MQQIWLTELGWDDALPPLLLQQSHEFLQDYPGLSPLRIPRWLNTSNTLSWSTFVANRVSSISKSTSGQSWSYLRSVDNPADLASRGVSAAELSASSLWWHGPDWLRRYPEYWPALNNELPDTQL
ncbi:uncharacterized protein [Drosophila tropicalis]|uniref:uncharacterized protein n=1 Tax=Drosophila tropicalis TaxID=46794 RepID=UPI0035AC18BA